jgi:hypothetical protein
MSGLLIAIGLMFIGSAIGAFLTQGTRVSLALTSMTIGAVSVAAGVAWSRVQKLFNAAFAQSLTGAASDARTWLALLIIVWVFVSTLLFFHRASDSAESVESLQAQIITLRNDLSFLQADYQRFKTPRLLTQKQTDEIGDYLATRDPQTVTIVYARDDREARQYAVEFRSALAKGRWMVTLADVEDAGFDVHIESDNPRGGTSETKAGVLLRMAFKEADVGGVGASQLGDGGPEATRLIVGSKRQ